MTGTAIAISMASTSVALAILRAIGPWLRASSSMRRCISVPMSAKGIEFATRDRPVRLNFFVDGL